MKALGIDFGSKRVGLAIGDDTSSLAFPYKVLPNDKNLLDEILAIIDKEGVTKIIIGESNDFDGKPNKIMGEINDFKHTLEEKNKLEIIFEPEFLTSHQAEKFQGKNDLHDASAAAIILQSYLDRHN